MESLLDTPTLQVLLQSGDSNIEHRETAIRGTQVQRTLDADDTGPGQEAAMKGRESLNFLDLISTSANKCTPRSTNLIEASSNIISPNCTCLLS